MLIIVIADIEPFEKKNNQILVLLL